jgi:Coenzyme A transferase
MALRFGKASNLARSHAVTFCKRANSAAANFQKKNKVYPSTAAAVADIPNGSKIFVGGFGPCGLPENLLTAVKDTNVKDLHVVTNNPGKLRCLVIAC